MPGSTWFSELRNLRATFQRLRLAYLAFILTCAPLPSHADAPTVCVDAAGNLLSSLSAEDPTTYSSETCAAAPPATVCDITGTPGPCRDVPACEALQTRIDTSTCTPENEANSCCTTFLTAPCVGCETVPLACLQFCFDTSVIADAVPATPANSTTPEPSASPTPTAPPPDPLPSPATDPATPVSPTPLELPSAPGITAEANQTPIGMPPQIIVESVSSATALLHSQALLVSLTSLTAMAALLLTAGL